MSGWKDWQIGEVVTEGDFQSLVQDQVVQRYANSTARDTTLGANVAEGMVAYLDDTNAVQIYNGTAWVPIGEGDITAVTAGTALTGGGTSGDVTLNVDLSAITIPTSQISDITATAAALNTIDDGTSGFTALSNGTAGISYQPVSHNYIINGAFDNWQRGDSFTVSSGYTSDRHRAFAGASLTYSKDAGTDGIENCIKMSANTNTFSLLVETVENGYTLLRGKTVTFSFYVKGSTAGVIGFRQARFATSVASPVGIVRQANISVTTDWQRVSRTYTIPSTADESNVNLIMYIDQRDGTNVTYDGDLFITGVQLEAGSVATPFKRHAPSLQGELAACQRYFYRLTAPLGFSSYATGFNSSTGESRGIIQFPVTMRVAPTSMLTTGIASDYSIARPGVNVTCSSVPGVQHVSDSLAHVRFIDATNSLTAGFASDLRSANVSNTFLAWDVEL